MQSPQQGSPQQGSPQQGSPQQGSPQQASWGLAHFEQLAICEKRSNRTPYQARMRVDLPSIRPRRSVEFTGRTLRFAGAIGTEFLPGSC